MERKLARFIGAFLGDGWIRHNPQGEYSVGLAIGQLHHPHTERYLALLQELFPKSNWKNNPHRTIGIITSSKAAHSQIIELGISGYSHEKRLPMWIKNADKDVKLEALGGYIDADGHACKDIKNTSRIHIGSCNLPLLNDFKSIAEDCGVSVTKIRTYHRTSNICYQIFHQCWISGMTAHAIPLWHEEKSKRSKLLFDKVSKKGKAVQPESYSLEINSQLKILDRLHRAEAIAFKLFYEPKSGVYDYIKKSIQGELEISWDQLLKLADPKKRKKTSDTDAELISEISERINYDLNQLLIQMAMLQDAFGAIEKMELNQKDAAQTCWISIQAQILDLRRKVLEKVPDELKMKAQDAIPQPVEQAGTSP